MNEETGRPDDYSNEPSRDIFSYSSMGLASEKWAPGEESRERQSLDAGWAFLPTRGLRYLAMREETFIISLIFLMILGLGAFVLCAGLYMGWDNFLTMLGWR